MTVDATHTDGRAPGPVPAGETPAASDDLTVTLAIPSLNEERSIARCLRSVAAQTRRPDHVLLVDGGSVDRTIEIATEVAEETGLPLTVLHNPARRVPQALNIALHHSSDDVFFKLSGHSALSPDYFEVLVRRLHEGHAAVGGRKEATAQTAQGRANAAALNSRLGVGGSKYHYATSPVAVTHVPSGGYHRGLAVDIGGWDETLPVHQDAEFDYRIGATGGSLLLDPAAVSYWSCRETLRGLFAQYRRYGRGKAAVGRRRPQSVSARVAVPSLCVIGVTAGLASYPFVRSRWLLLPAASYVGALAVGATSTRHRPAARVAAAAAAIHWGQGLGVIEGLMGRAPAPSQQIDGPDSSGGRA